MQIDDQTLIDKLLTGAGVALVSLGAWAARVFAKRIDKLEETALQKRDFDRLEKFVQENIVRKDIFEDHVARDDKAAETLSSALRDLTARLDTIRDMLIRHGGNDR